MKWFKHDSDANNDAKLWKVRLKYGMEGYGLYWYCLELIAGNISETNLTFELEHDSEVIAGQTGIHYELVQEMMTYMCDLGLFEIRGNNIVCMKLLKRLDKSMTSNKGFRQMIDSAKENHDLVMTNPDLVMQDKTRLDKTRKEKTYRAAKRVPPRWSISDAGCDFALSVGMDQTTVTDQLDQFRDHEFKTARKDWDAAWRTWCRNWKKWRKDEKDRSSSDDFGSKLDNLRRKAGRL